MAEIIGDCYISRDGGRDWIQQTSSAWQSVADHSMVVRKDGAVVKFGGYSRGGDYTAEVYESSDAGMTWVFNAGPAAFGGSVAGGASMVVRADGHLLIIGGEYGPMMYSDDVWRSQDGGSQWEKIGGGDFSGSAFHAAVVTQ